VQETSLVESESSSSGKFVLPSFLNCDRAKDELGWKPEKNFDQGLAETVRWYEENHQWSSQIESGEYLNSYRDNYNRVKVG